MHHRADDYPLAQAAGLGRVFLCGGCDHVHLTIGPVTMTLSEEAYMQLVSMLHSSAANFEVMMEERTRGTQEESGDGIHHGD